MSGMQADADGGAPMGKKKDKQKRDKAKEKGLDRRAAEFADEVRTPANE